MRTLTKFDVLLYMQHTEKLEDLIAMIKKNALFEHVSERTIRIRINELKKQGFIDKPRIDTNNVKTINCLAFLHWARLRELDFNQLLNKNVINVFASVFEANQISLQELMKKKGLSKPTVLKITDLLEKARLIKTVKRKPKIVSINLNDASFFYANFLDLSFDSFQKTFTFPNIKKIESKRISEQLIRLHAYSTTVTEGNTATEDDVRKIFDNHPVKLTPREITEILNARRAIDHLYEICNNDVSLFELKKIHEILMDNLVENAGEFFYGTKRVIGSETRFPTAKEEIDIMIISLLSFWNKNIRALNPLLLGTLVHFMFVTIHPFADGNGRVARLLHSWVLLKSKLPLFVYHVNKKNTYFDLIERGRKESIDNFVKFCSDEYSNCLIDIDGRIHQ